jgi:outer membrane protein TolC
MRDATVHPMPRVHVVGLSLLFLVAGCAQTSQAHPLRQPAEPAATPASPAEQAAPSVDLSAPTLAQLLHSALQRSPAIQAARERALARAEGAAAAGWLPDPQVTFGWYETAVETRVGPQEWSIGLQQRVPFPTKLVKQREIADAEARRAQVAYERTVRDVLVDVVRTAHEIAYVDQATQITEDVAALLERYVAATAGDDSVLASELFRAETQHAQLLNDRVILAELRAAETQHLLAVLDLPPDTALGSPRIGPVPAIDADFVQLLELASRHSQELREAGLALDAATLRSSLAEQRRVPDFSVGVKRIATDPLNPVLGLNPAGNGDDPVIVETLQRTRSQLARTWFRVGNAERLTRLYADTLIPRAVIAARTAEDLLAAGKGSIAGALETIAVLHNFRLAEARARADHGRAVADLERVIGRPFDGPDTAEVVR